MRAEVFFSLSVFKARTIATPTPSQSPRSAVAIKNVRMRNRLSRGERIEGARTVRGGSGPARSGCGGTFPEEPDKSGQFQWWALGHYKSETA